MIEPGDVVKCVNVDPWPNEDDVDPPYELQLGRLYRVASVWFDGETFLLLPREIAEPSTESGGYGLHRFRKLPKAEATFTRAIRKCRPIKTREDA